MQTELKGLFFDPDRKRWRVRLYRGHRVVHLSYHRTEEAARAAHAKFAEDRPEVKLPPASTATADLLNFLTS